MYRSLLWIVSVCLQGSSQDCSDGALIIIITVVMPSRLVLVTIVMEPTSRQFYYITLPYDEPCTVTGHTDSAVSSRLQVKCGLIGGLLVILVLLVWSHRGLSDHSDHLNLKPAI